LGQLQADSAHQPQAGGDGAAQGEADDVPDQVPVSHGYLRERSSTRGVESNPTRSGGRRQSHPAPPEPSVVPMTVWRPPRPVGDSAHGPNVPPDRGPPHLTRGGSARAGWSHQAREDDIMSVSTQP